MERASLYGVVARKRIKDVIFWQCKCGNECNIGNGYSIVVSFQLLVNRLDFYGDILYYLKYAGRFD